MGNAVQSQTHHYYSFLLLASRETGGKVPYITEQWCKLFWDPSNESITKHMKGILSILLMDSISRKKNTQGILKAFLIELMSIKCLVYTKHCTNCHITSWHLPFHGPTLHGKLRMENLSNRHKARQLRRSIVQLNTKLLPISYLTTSDLSDGD